MSMHKIPLTAAEEEGLKRHGLARGTPSQLSDVFRQGMAFAKENSDRIQQEMIARLNAADERILQLEAQSVPALSVWYGAMPETNGKSNWTALLHNGDFTTGITIARSEYPDRVRYEADRMRFLIGELKDEPFILDYDAEKHSGYVKPQSVPVVGEPVREALPIGTKYYYPTVQYTDTVDAFTWQGDSFDKRLLARGLVHLTKEAAIEHAKALIIVSGGKV